MKSQYCIYVHISPSGKVYVGQSNNYKKRWGYNGEHYMSRKDNGDYVQRLFARAILKYGWQNFEHKIILENISKAEADYAEKYLIRWYKIHNISYNITDGGEGVSCPKPKLSESRKRQISIRMSTNHPMKGKHHTIEALAKITYMNRHKSYTDKQKRAMATRCDRIRHLASTESARKKLSDYKKVHPEQWIGGWNKKEVHQYDLEGNYIASFHSMTEAALKVANKDNVSDIKRCIVGETASAFGYIWKAEKVDHIDVSNYKIVKTSNGTRLLNMSEKSRMKRSAAHGKAVNQYSLDGKYIATYCSALEATRKIGGTHTAISRCCKHLPRHVTAKGYLWEYDNIENRKDKVIA